jgi:DNA-binding LacI/PurR family transcriptional regulator
VSDEFRRPPDDPLVPRTREVSSAATIRQVAAMAGVSTATVSRVLAHSGRVSPDLESRVRAAAKALNYQPNRAARALRARQGSTVGVLIPDIQNLFFTAIVRGIDDEIQKHGYTVLLANSDASYDRERVYLDTFRAEGVAGLLVVPSQHDDRIYREFLHTGIPLVILDRTVRLPNVDIVSVTNAEGSAEAVAHLVSLGHRRIAMIAGLEAHNVGAERRRGYLTGLEAAGLPYDPTIVKDAGFEREAARRATHELLELPDPPTAIFSANNTMSLGVLQAIHERGLGCPQDVSIVGFDDMPWQVATQPPLTCVSQPTYDIGASAARLLIARIADPTRPVRRVVLETALIVRGSSGPPPVR